MSRFRGLFQHRFMRRLAGVASALPGNIGLEASIVHLSRNVSMIALSIEPTRGRLAAMDQYVGLRIRERRMAFGLSQHQFARRIGCTYQQVHKYERGMNRVSAGRLYSISSALNAPIAWFFEGLPTADVEADLLPCRRLLLEFMRDVSTINEVWQLDALGRLAGALAREPETQA